MSPIVNTILVLLLSMYGLVYLSDITEVVFESSLQKQELIRFGRGREWECSLTNKSITIQELQKSITNLDQPDVVLDKDKGE